MDSKPGLRGSKAGRNEARKLAANALNNTGVAFVLAALLQPILTFLQQDRAPTLAASIASTILVVVSSGLFVATSPVHGLED